MVRWAQLNVARFTGGILGNEISAKIRGVSLDIERLWELAEISCKVMSSETHALSDFIDSHNHKIIDVIVVHYEPARPT